METEKCYIFCAGCFHWGAMAFEMCLEQDACSFSTNISKVAPGFECLAPDNC